MDAKKELWEKAKKDGIIKRVNRTLAASYLLVSEAYLLYTDAEDDLSKYGLKIGETKQLLNRLEKSLDMFINHFKVIIKDKEEKDNYFADLDEFDKYFREWAKLNEDETA